MRANRYTAFIDSCVLAGALSRNMVLSLAEAGFFRVRWSDEILSETERAIAGILREKGVAESDVLALKHCDAIRRAFPEASVEGYRPLIPSIHLPDEKDRHVIAAAVQTSAAVVVTNNTKHFPPEYVEQFDLTVSTADEFLSDVIDLHTPETVSVLRRMRQRFNRPEVDAETLLRRMESVGLTETANLLLREISLL